MSDSQDQEKASNKSNPSSSRAHRLLRWLFGGLLVLFVFVVSLILVVQIPAVQKWGINKATAYFQEEWGATVYIGSFKLSLAHFLILEDLYVEDQGGGHLLSIGKLYSGFDKHLLNILRSKLALEELILEDVRIHLIRKDEKFNFAHIIDYFSIDKKKSSSGSKFDLSVERVRMSNIAFKLDNLDTELYFTTLVESIDLKVNQIDINELLFDMERIHLYRPYVHLMRKERNAIEADTSRVVLEEISYLVEELRQVTSSKVDLRILAESVKIIDGRFQLENYQRVLGREKPKDAIDFDFVGLLGLQIDLEQVDFRDFDIGATICQIQFMTDGGFTLNSLQSARFRMDRKRLELDNFVLLTPHSRLGDQLRFSYEDLDDFQRFEDLVFIDAQFKNAHFGIPDLYFFAPEVRENPFLRRNAKGKIQIEGRTRGRVNALRGESVDLNFADKVRYQGDFGTRNLTRPDETILNLDIISLTSSMVHLKQLIPGFNLPEHFDRLGNIVFQGQFDGFYQDFVTYGTIRTDLGVATTDIQLNTQKGIRNATYRGKLNLSNFNVKRFLQLEDFGYLTMSAQVNNGKGLELDNIQANLAAKIDRFDFRGYTYEDIRFDGKLVKDLLNGKVSIRDENVDLDFDGFIDFVDEVPILNFQSNIRLLDLYKINLIERPLTVVGDIDLEVEYKDLSNIEGFVSMNDVVISIESGEYLYINNIYATSRYKGSEEKQFTLKSDLVDFDLKGVFELEYLPNTLIEVIRDKQPVFADILGLSSSFDRIGNNDFRFNGTIHNSKNLTHLLGIPIDTLQSVRLRGRFANEGVQNMKYTISELSLPKLVIDGNQLVGVKLYIDGDQDESIGIVHLDKAYFGGLELDNLDGMIELQKDTVLFRLGVDNFAKSLSNMGIVGEMFIIEDRLVMRFDNFDFDALDTRWRIAERNFIQYKKDFLYTRNMRFTNGVGFISISTGEGKNALLLGDDIELALFNRLLSESGIELQGRATFQFNIDDYQAISDLKGVASVRNLRFNEIALGNARLIASQDNLLSATLLELTIGDTGRDLKGRGYVKLPGVPMNPGDLRYSFDFFMDRFPIKPAEYFLQDLISETRGTFSGDFFIEGDSTIRNIGGDLTLLDASTKIDYLGTTYAIRDSRVTMDNENIYLDAVTLHDIAGNRAQVRGVIRHEKFRNLETDFRITSPNFAILNTRKEDNDLFYGRAQGRIDIRFNGPFDAMDLYISATSGPNTVVAIPLTTAKEVKEQNFIIFIDRNQKEATETPRSQGGLALRMDLTVTPDAQLQLIFDERTGDIVKGVGTGNIQLELPRNGDFQMYGDFNIIRGEYPFRAVVFLDKAFTVKEGGSIVWYGDPLDAVIDLEAEYKGLKTSPFNLISEYLREEELREQARRPTEVDLTLKLTGSLLQPDIQFNIQFPQLVGELRNYTDNKLRTLASDQNELNNLAFQLLFFKSFIPNQSDILSTQGGLGIASSTLTEWFTNQVRVFVNEYLIDSISNRAISDVDLDFGIVLNTEFSQSLEGLVAAGQSQFYVRPRVQMFDDRVILDFGINNYGRLGSDNRLAGEFNLEYAFGNSRRFRTKVYSQDQPLPSLGRRTVFGAGLVYRREYDEFADIFRWRGKKRKPSTITRDTVVPTTIPPVDTTGSSRR